MGQVHEDEAAALRVHAGSLPVDGLLTFETPTFVGERRVTRREGQRRAGQRMMMLATFTDWSAHGSEERAPLEYRQEVRGRFTLDGETLPHPLADGQLLDPLEWREDGMVRRLAGVERTIFYGHRDAEAHPADAYLPARLNGWRYEGHAHPSLAGPKGLPFCIDLDFRGRIINTQSGETIASRTWSLRMAGLLSRRGGAWE